MFRKEHSIVVNASPEAVFDYVSNLETHPSWAHEKMVMTVAPGQEGGAGTSFSTEVKMFGNVKGTGKVVEANRPSRFAYECSDSSGRYLWVFDIAPEGGGARVTYSFERLDAPAWFKLLQGPVFYPIFGRSMMSGGLANIKQRIEAGSTS